jgi:hypothetical protein
MGLKVALVHTDNPRAREGRMVGIWSYGVPQFEIEHFPQPKKVRLNKEQFSAFDVIFHEDHKNWGRYIGDGPPVAYYIVDSTLSDNHYRVRLEKAREIADMVFVDWDDLARFDLKVPVYRLSHCVNDRLFHDYGLDKATDIAFNCMRKGPGSDKRALLDIWLNEYCERKGLVYDNRILPDREYAQAMNRAKVVVQVNRTPATRAHRTFDAMACRSCLVTDPLPEVSDEARWAPQHYLEYHDLDELGQILDGLLATEGWRQIAENGYQLVQAEHTWSVRAEYLHEKLCELIN